MICWFGICEQVLRWLLLNPTKTKRKTKSYESVWKSVTLVLARSTLLVHLAQDSWTVVVTEAAAMDPGLCRATTVKQVIWNLLWPHAQGRADDFLSPNSIDVFISHSWSVSFWKKILAICHYFCLDWALISAFLSFVLAILALLLRAHGNFNEIVEEGQGMVGGTVAMLPSLVFLFVYFFGHLLSTKTVWFDRLCVDQVDLPLKAKTLQAIPDFVSQAKQMLVIWDETFFTKLWCIYEVTIRAKKASLEFLHILPVWVPLFDLFCITANCAVCFAAYPTGWRPPSLPKDVSARFSLLLSFYVGSPLYYIIFALPYQYVCSLKIRLHTKMLDQMSSFDFGEARCALETDRVLIRRQVCSFFDEVSQPPLSISLDSLPAEVLPVIETNPTDLEVSALLSTAEHIEQVRGITSYAGEDQIVDEFNAYVHGPLKQNVVRSLGHEAHISFKVCMAANMPLIFSGAAVVLTCHGYADCSTAANHLFIDSVAKYMFLNAFLLIILCPATYMLMLPMLLRISHLVGQMEAPLFLHLLVENLAFASALAFLWGFCGISSCLLMIGASEREPLCLLGAVVGFTVECWCLWIFFRQKPRHNVSSQRILGCAAA